MKLKALSAALAVLAGLSGAASAATYNHEVASNAYVTKGGLDWAWANPLPNDVAPIDFSFQGAFGWRLPTLAELLASAPTALEFLFPGANVPFNGTDPVSGSRFQATNADYTGAGACAAAYFSLSYVHCDWQDGLGQPLGPWAGMPGAFSFAEQLVVRDAMGAVPLPAGIVLLGGGLGAFFGFGRKKRRAA